MPDIIVNLIDKRNSGKLLNFKQTLTLRFTVDIPGNFWKASA